MVVDAVSDLKDAVAKELHAEIAVKLRRTRWGWFPLVMAKSGLENSIFPWFFWP